LDIEIPIIAIRHHSLNCLRYLCEYDLITLKDSQRCLLDYAIQSKFWEIGFLRLCHEQGVSFDNTLHVIAPFQNIDVNFCKALIEMVPGLIGRRNGQGRSPLMQAIIYNNVTLAKTLLEYENTSIIGKDVIKSDVEEFLENGLRYVDVRSKDGVEIVRAFLKKDMRSRYMRKSTSYMISETPKEEYSRGVDNLPVLEQSLTRKLFVYAVTSSKYNYSEQQENLIRACTDFLSISEYDFIVENELKTPIIRLTFNGLLYKVRQRLILWICLNFKKQYGNSPNFNRKYLHCVLEYLIDV